MSIGDVFNKSDKIGVLLLFISLLFVSLNGGLLANRGDDKVNESESLIIFQGNNNKKIAIFYLFVKIKFVLLYKKKYE